MRQALFISVSILGIAVAILFLKRIRPADLQTSDFINFYAAGSIVRRGDSATLYTRETQNAAFHIVHLRFVLCPVGTQARRCCRCRACPGSNQISVSSGVSPSDLGLAEVSFPGWVLSGESRVGLRFCNHSRHERAAYIFHFPAELRGPFRIRKPQSDSDGKLAGFSGGHGSYCSSRRLYTVWKFRTFGVGLRLHASAGGARHESRLCDLLNHLVDGIAIYAFPRCVFAAAVDSDCSGPRSWHPARVLCEARSILLCASILVALAPARSRRTLLVEQPHLFSFSRPLAIPACDCRSASSRESYIRPDCSGLSRHRPQVSECKHHCDEVRKRAAYND